MNTFLRFGSFVSLVVSVCVGPATLFAATVVANPEQVATPSSKPAATDSACDALPREKDVFRKEDGISPPKAKYALDPEYSGGARKGKLQGRVLLCVTVDTQGKVSDAVVVKTLTDEFDQSAVKAVRKWKFKPGIKDGKPVAVQINVVVDFSPSG
jgi:TonB family protein